MVLAAGRGTRMQPLTNATPKPMLLFEGRPLIDHILDALEALVEEVVVITGYKARQIEEYLGDRCAFIRQSEQLGTAHALLQAEPILHEDFIVAAGDSIFPPAHIHELTGLHYRLGADATLSLKRLPPRRISSSSEVHWDGQWIHHIREKPPVGEIKGDLAASMLYVLSPIVFEYIERISPSSRGELELTDAFQLMIKDGLSVAGALCEDWVHVTHPGDLYDESGE